MRFVSQRRAVWLLPPFRSFGRDAIREPFYGRLSLSFRLVSVSKHKLRDARILVVISVPIHTEKLIVAGSDGSIALRLASAGRLVRTHASPFTASAKKKSENLDCA